MRSDLKVQLLVECVAFLFAIEFRSFLYVVSILCFFFLFKWCFASFVFFLSVVICSLYAFIACIQLYVCIFLLLFVIRTDCIWFVLSHVYTEAESLHWIASLHLFSSDLMHSHKKKESKRQRQPHSKEGVTRMISWCELQCTFYMIYWFIKCIFFGVHACVPFLKSTSSDRKWNWCVWHEQSNKMKGICNWISFALFDSMLNYFFFVVFLFFSIGFFFYRGISLTLIALMQTRWQKSAVNPFNGSLN